MEQAQQNTTEKGNKIASYNYTLKDKEQNEYIVDLIIYEKKFVIKAKQSSDILNLIYKNEIGLNDLVQMHKKIFGNYENMQEINEDYFKYLKKDDFIISKKDNSINIEIIIPHGFKKINLFFDLNLVKNKIEDNLINILNNFNEFKKFVTDKINFLEKANSEKDIEIEKLNKKIETLISDKKNKENLTNKKIDNCVKKFIYPKKIIYCLKVDAQIDISNYIDYNLKFGLDWFKPGSSYELNDIIEHFYNNYQIYDIPQACWIITYGVETDPNEKKVGGYVMNADGNGYYYGDNNIPGKCNGSGFTAFRKIGCSFANPNHFKKLCNWDSSYKFSIICLQENI